jgi:cysteinyl-tRNA synthetase
VRTIHEEHGVHFHLGTAAADAGDRIIYDQPTGRLYYDPDGTGARAQVLFAVLDNHAAITSVDFLIS